MKALGLDIQVHKEGDGVFLSMAQLKFLLEEAGTTLDEILYRAGNTKIEREKTAAQLKTEATQIETTAQTARDAKVRQADEELRTQKGVATKMKTDAKDNADKATTTAQIFQALHVPVPTAQPETVAPKNNGSN